jgi:hypothetical protein
MSESDMAAGAVDQYFSYLTTSLALCLALALPLAAGAVIGKRWKGHSARSLWLFGLVPVMGFVGHATEPLVVGSGGSSNVSELAPLVLVGLLIQIPFALVAVGLARQVLWLAESLALALAGSNRKHAPRPPERYPRPRASRASGFRLDLSYTERGPPLLAA